MRSRIDVAFFKAKTMIRNHNFDQTIIKRLEMVTVRSITKKMANDRYDKAAQEKIRQTVAFYDPNENIIFINRERLLRLETGEIIEVFVHELMHAISCHWSFRNDNELVLFSGLKRQYFKSGRQCTKFVALNEGFVQYMANLVLGSQTDAYQKEVEFARLIVGLIGEESLRDGFFAQKIDQLQENVELTLGWKRFELACERLDRGDYTRAQRLIITPERVAPVFGWSLES